MSTKKCSTNPKSPPPPCPEGYVQKKNKYDEECCYKLTAKQMKAMQNSTKKKENSKKRRTAPLVQSLATTNDEFVQGGFCPGLTNSIALPKQDQGVPKLAPRNV